MASVRTQSTILVLAAILVIAGTGTLIAWVARGSAASPGGPAASEQSGEAPPEALAMMVIPKFSLVDQDDAAVSEEIFSGRLTILAFSFTNCPTVCPIMHSHLVRLLHETLDRSPVRIVTISVDPAHDTPAALRAYAERLEIDTERWKMLTGDKEVIHSIVRSMRFAIADDPSLTVTLASGETMANITHPSKFVLVGPKGTVIGLASGLDWDSAQRLALHAKELALRLGLR